MAQQPGHCCYVQPPVTNDHFSLCSAISSKCSEFTSLLHAVSAGSLNSGHIELCNAQNNAASEPKNLDSESRSPNLFSARIQLHAHATSSPVKALCMRLLKSSSSFFLPSACLAFSASMSSTSEANSCWRGRGGSGIGICLSFTIVKAL